MKKQLKDCIIALRITDQMPSCELKEGQINDILIEIAKLGISIEDHTSKRGDIRYREFDVTDTKEGFEVSVKIIETCSDDLIIIDADFGEEEEYMSSNVVDS